ncbi:hypothetical protein C1646_767484 [Rhizophagus diaphanus]|nr:hypothetical protein C1646_767484 [Rhizophagus diaphanus] [Rhizophagus sp. MUCL 43196]
MFKQFKLFIYPSHNFNFMNTCGNEYTLSDHNRSSYSKIRQITNTRHNNNNSNNYNQKHTTVADQHIPQNRRHPYTVNRSKQNYNTNDNQTKNSQTKQYTQKTNLDQVNKFINSTTQSNDSIPDATNTNIVHDTTEIERLKVKIAKLETIIKDISSELQLNTTRQKQHTEEIKLLKDQERLHTILENIQANSFHNHNDGSNDAYGENNYAHPPHHQYEDEEFYDNSQNDYGSNNGYESSGTVNEEVHPDPDYTPSRVRSGFPSLTSTVGWTYDGQQ